MAITNTIITSSNTTLFTSNGNSAITTVIFCNTSAYDGSNPTLNQSSLTVYAVQSGQTPSPANMIINDLIVPASETVSLDQEKLVLSAGDKLIAKSNNLSNIAATVSYLAV